MACECKQLERALGAARAVAAIIERDCERPDPSIRLRLARAHVLGACDELEGALDDHRRGARCEELEDACRPPGPRDFPGAPKQEASGPSLGAA